MIFLTAYKRNPTKMGIFSQISTRMRLIHLLKVVIFQIAWTSHQSKRHIPLQATIKQIVLPEDTTQKRHPSFLSHMLNTVISIDILNMDTIPVIQLVECHNLDLLLYLVEAIIKVGTHSIICLAIIHSSSCNGRVLLQS